MRSKFSFPDGTVKESQAIVNKFPEQEKERDECNERPEKNDQDKCSDRNRGNEMDDKQNQSQASRNNSASDQNNGKRI